MSKRARTISRLVSAFVAAGLVLGAAVVVVGTAPGVKACVTTTGCDFLTGGGWIVYRGAKANFGVGGGCKHGSGTNGIPYWGHLEYIDHGKGLNVHATSITAYFPDGDTGTDPKTHQPTGARFICGTARTNLYGDASFVVRARDAGEPGVNDTFDIRVTSPDGATVFYQTIDECTWHYLGSSAPCMPGNGGGGNIQLHKPNPSTTGDFGGSCPAF
jgi:hypothetical protein